MGAALWPALSFCGKERGNKEKKMQYPSIDPVALSVGPLQLHWYGLMYVFAFLTGWLLGRWRASRPWSGWTAAQVDDFVTWVMLGVILGARLGYVLFYDLSAYLADPMEILRVWNGGMSFHGGLIGVVTASWIWGRRNGKTLIEILDFVAPLVPTGLFFGRIGNFINAELWGRVTDGPLGMVFPGAGPLPRHPSQLYEAGLEGVLTFLILWFYSSRPRSRGRWRDCSPCCILQAASPWNSSVYLMPRSVILPEDGSQWGSCFVCLSWRPGCGLCYAQ